MDFLSINYFINNFVISFMDRETIDLYIRYETLSDTDIQNMGIQELFDHRHGLLQLQNKLEALLNKKKAS